MRRGRLLQKGVSVVRWWIVPPDVACYGSVVKGKRDFAVVRFQYKGCGKIPRFRPFFKPPMNHDSELDSQIISSFFFSSVEFYQCSGRKTQYSHLPSYAFII